MKASFAARRKPKATARDQDDDQDHQAESESATVLSAVKRPNIRSKQISSRSTSFRATAGINTSQHPSEDDTEPFALKRSTLSQQAIARNAQKKAGINLSDNDKRLSSIGRDDDRPSYSTEALALLKDSTPATPISIENIGDEQRLLGELDIAAKFGADYITRSGIAGIPTDAEVAEKKARRARIAKEMEYQAISDSGSDEDQPMLDAGHDSDDNEFRMQIDRVALHDPRNQKYPETRFVRDDEDILEGFDEFTQTSNGGRIEIGRKAEKAAKRRARADMKMMIENAEGSEIEDSDDSERERREMYEATQTRKAIGSLRPSGMQDAVIPPRMPPIPTLGGILDKIRAAIEEVELLRQAKQRDIEEIEQERREIAEREEDVQRALKETAEQYQRLSVEAGLIVSTSGNNELDVQDVLALKDENKHVGQRGLENMAGSAFS